MSAEIRRWFVVVALALAGGFAWQHFAALGHGMVGAIYGLLLPGGAALEWRAASAIIVLSGKSVVSASPS